ncbi:MAG: beta-carotene ketolase [Gammaproteobacteria bacterium BRH_c0]|nr:MAG: beta-carotene ketolase [Gammaproteobacteria bacterium BRH_c0]
MNRDYDVIIIGAGHNGMTAAGYLSRAGKKVLVVERNAKVGGMTTSGFMIPEAPNHMVTPCAIEIIYLRQTGVIEDLELAKHGLRMIEPDPPYAYLHPDGSSICLFRDPKRTAEDIARIHPADGKAYLKFMEVLNALYEIGSPMMALDQGRPQPKVLWQMVKALVRNRKLRSELEAITSSTSDQVACEWFEHPATIAYLTGIASGAGPIDQDGNAAAYTMISMLHRIGTGKPIGSLQALSDAFASSIKASGATIMVNASVAEIIVENGETRGVRLEDGKVIGSKVVVASCDPKLAYQMVTPGGIERRLMQRMDHAPMARDNAAPFLANVAISKPLTLKRHQDLRHDDADLTKAVGMIGLVEDVRESFWAARRGEIPARHCLSVTPTSNIDSSQVPPGEAVAYIYLPSIAVKLRDGEWNQERKDYAMQTIMAQVNEFYDGFDAEVGRFVESPIDRQKRVNITNGCVTHIDFAASRSGLKRPAYGLGGPKPVVPGFFLGGASIHPGGGVTGLPGKITSDRVKHYLKKNP